MRDILPRGMPDPFTRAGNLPRSQRRLLILDLSCQVPFLWQSPLTLELRPKRMMLGKLLWGLICREAGNVIADDL